MSSYDRNIERLRSAERSNAQNAMSQRTNMANITGQRGIEEAERMSKSLSAFSSTLKKLRDQHIEEQFKIGFKEYKQYKKVNAEKYLELEKQINDAKGNQKLIEELRRKQIDLKGVNGYVDAERISHLSDYAQIGFVNAQLKSVIPTFEPKLQNAMQNSDKELIINGVKFKTKDIHNDNTDPLEFKRAGIEFHADSIWKNSGLDRYSPELLELAGVTEAFDKAKKSLNDKYTQRYNIEKGSEHREEAEKIFENSKKTGDDIELLYKSYYSTFDDKGKLMTREGAWQGVDAKIISGALASNEDVDDYITKMLDQEIPERWAKQLGVKKGTTFAEHWPKKAQTLIAKAKKTRSDALDADIKHAKNEEKSILKKFLNQKADGAIKERKDHPDDTEWSMEEYEAWYTSRGLDLPEAIKTHKTAFDNEVEADKVIIQNALLTNKRIITPEWLARLNPYAKKGLESQIRQALEANEKDIMTDVGPMNPRDLIKGKIDHTLTDMNLKGQEKTDTQVYSIGLAEEAYLEKFYQNLNKNMTREEAAHDALYGPNGVITDITNNQNNSQYIKNGAHKSEMERFKPDQVVQAEIQLAKRELKNGRDWRREHIGGEYAEKHLETIMENIKRHGLWAGLNASKDAVSYYQRITWQKHFDGGGDYIKFIDSQLRLKGHPGFFGAEIDINEYNNKLALNKAAWDYEHGSLIDNEGFNAVWNDAINTLQFKDIDHWLHAKMNIEDSFNPDSGFWSEYDNLSFVTDYDLEYGEIFLND